MFNQDHSGEITFDEFYKIMTGVKEIKEDISNFALSDMGKQDECRQVFDEIDTDGSDSLDREELSLLAKKLGHLIPRRHLLHAMEEMLEMTEGRATGAPLWRVNCRIRG